MTCFVKRFTDLEVWRRSHQLFLDLAKDLDLFPLKRRVAIMTDRIRGRIGSVGSEYRRKFQS